MTTGDGTMLRGAAVLDGCSALACIAGGTALVLGLISPPAALLAGSPFSSYVVPGILLAGVVGGAALVATILALRRSDPATVAYATLFAGCTLVGWIVIETGIIGLESWLQPATTAVGAAQIALAVTIGVAPRTLDVHERGGRLAAALLTGGATWIAGLDTAVGILLAVATGYLAATAAFASCPILLAVRRVIPRHQDRTSAT